MDFRDDQHKDTSSHRYTEYSHREGVVLVCIFVGVYFVFPPLRLIREIANVLDLADFVQ